MDIVLIVLDASKERTEEDEALLRGADDRAIVCLNKCDLPRKSDYPGSFKISAHTGDGVDALMQEMERRLCDAVGAEDKMIQERHLTLARRAMDALADAQRCVEEGHPLDLAEIDLRRALTALSEITGEDATEEVINQVFRNFCVGK